MKKVVHIAHCSDLHISTILTGSRVRRFLKSAPLLPWFDPYAIVDPPALRAISSYLYKKNGLDLFVITGDVLDSGWVHDARIGQRILLSPIQSTSSLYPHLHNNSRQLSIYLPSFQAAGIPILFFPGNTDRYPDPFVRSPTTTAFDTVLSSTWFAGHRGVQSYALPHIPLTVISADLSLSTLGTGRSHSQGEVTQDVLDKLYEQTMTAQEVRGRAVIWAIHFLPILPQLCPPNLTMQTDYYPQELILHNEGALVDLARTCKVHHILCGHGHFSGWNRISREVVVHYCGTSGCTRANMETTIQEVTLWLNTDNNGAWQTDVNGFKNRPVVYSKPKTANSGQFV